MEKKQGVSRRRLMKRAAATAATPAIVAGLAAQEAGAAATEVSVAATVVRTSHSAAAPHALRIGVRASVQAPEFSADNLVFVVEPVRFASSPQETGRQIAESVRRQVAELLERRGASTNASRIDVHVFGGAL